MKLNTNFRATQLKRVRLVIASLYLFSGLSVVAGAWLLAGLSNLSETLASAKLHSRELEAERNSKLNIYQGLRDVSANDLGLNDEWLSLFNVYRGRSPEYLLYDIEKHAPQRLYLTGFSYDRKAGNASISAITEEPGQISTMLERLEQTENYSKVLLVNKSDAKKQGDVKVVLRLEEAAIRGEND